MNYFFFCERCDTAVQIKKIAVSIASISAMYGCIQVGIICLRTLRETVLLLACPPFPSFAMNLTFSSPFHPVLGVM